MLLPWIRWLSCRPTFRLHRARRAFPISGIAASAGIPADAAEPYGSYLAKIDPRRIDVDADGNISGLF